MTKKVIGLLTLIALVTVLSGYLSSLTSSAYDNEQLIATSNDDYTATEKTGGVEDHSAFYDYEDFNGVDTVFTIEGNQTVNITVYQNVTAGRLKVVLVDPYENVKLLNETTEINAVQGYYKVKIVGDYASGLVSINIEAVSDTYYPSFIK